MAGKGDISSLLPISKFSKHQSSLLLAYNYYIPNMGVFVPRGNCPINEGSCPEGYFAVGVTVPGVVVLSSGLVTASSHQELTVKYH